MMAMAAPVLGVTAAEGVQTPMGPKIGAKMRAVHTPDDVRSMFASPVFSPGDSPAAADGSPMRMAGGAGDAGDAGSKAPVLTAELRRVIAPLEEKISTVVQDVSRLEREKAQWMELYARSEIDFAVMISQSTNDAARAVVADCDAFVANVQSNWIAAAARRRNRARVSEAFVTWTTASLHEQTLRRLLSRGLKRAAGNRLRNAIAVWVAVCFCGALREGSTEAGASPIGSGSPVPGDDTLAGRLEGIAAYARTLADDFDAASPSVRHVRDTADEPSPHPVDLATNKKNHPGSVLHDSRAVPSDLPVHVEPTSVHVSGVVGAGRVEECTEDSAESADEVDVQSFLDGIESGDSEAEGGLDSQEAMPFKQLQQEDPTQLDAGLEDLYDMLAVASTSIEDCDACILPSDLMNDSHSDETNCPPELCSRPEAPLAKFLERNSAHGSGEMPRGLDFAAVEPMAPIHAVCSFAGTSSTDAEKDEDVEGTREYIPDVACVTIDLESLMARYESQLGGSVAFDLENGGLLSAFERAAVVQMDTAAHAHYVDGLLRLVLYSWVEFTKWHLGTTRTHLGPREVAGEPADVTVLERVADSDAEDEIQELDDDSFSTHDVCDAFSETGSSVGEVDFDYSMLHGPHDQNFEVDCASFCSDTDDGCDADADLGFDYRSCMPANAREFDSDDTSSSPEWAGDGDSFLLKQKVIAQRAQRGRLDWADSAVPYAVPTYAGPYVSVAEQQAEQMLMERIDQIRGDSGSCLRNRWADQLLLDMQCSARRDGEAAKTYLYDGVDNSVSQQLSDGSQSDAFGSTVAYDGDACTFENDISETLAQSECSDASSECTDVDAQCNSLLEQVAKLQPEDAELADLVEESIRTLDTLREAIEAADAATAAIDRTALDRKRCEELCLQREELHLQHKARGDATDDRFSPPISPTSPLDCFVAGGQFSGLAA